MTNTKQSFQLRRTVFHGFEQYILEDKINKNSFAIMPQKGASITELQFDGTTILDGYQTLEEINQRSWSKSAILLPFPNRLKGGKYSFEGKNYQFPCNEFGRNNLHGFPYDLNFQVRQTYQKENSIGIVLGHTYNAIYNYYPFFFDIEIDFSLQNVNQFKGKVKIQNQGKNNMPIGFGWHPYFQFGKQVDEIDLELPSLNEVIVDEVQIPVGEKKINKAFEEERKLESTLLDTCFKHYGNSKDIVVKLSSEKFQLVYRQDADPFKFVQLFIPPSRKSIAIEPMTCNVNAFQSGDGLKILAPHEVLEGSFDVTFVKKEI